MTGRSSRKRPRAASQASVATAVKILGSFSHEDCSVGADDERRRRAVTETAGGDVQRRFRARDTPLPRLYIVIGTVTEGQKGSAECRPTCTRGLRPCDRWRAGPQATETTFSWRPPRPQSASTSFDERSDRQKPRPPTACLRRRWARAGSAATETKNGGRRGPSRVRLVPVACTPPSASTASEKALPAAQSTTVTPSSRTGQWHERVAAYWHGHSSRPGSPSCPNFRAPQLLRRARA